MPVRLRNISVDGAMLDGIGDLTPGMQVVLELSGVLAAPGQVRWSRSGQIGIRFDHAVDLAALAHADHQPSPQSPHMVKPDYLQTELEPDSPWAARWERLTADDL